MDMESISISSFMIMVVLLSLSGVLMPGPVTAVTLAAGSESPHAGAWVAIGHGIIEFPLMAAIFFGAGMLFQHLPVKIGIGFAGGVILLWMGAGMLRDFDLVRAPGGESSGSRSPLAAGALLSLANPYFLIWWATAGAALISQSMKFGVIGFALLAGVHWSCDLVWYYFLSAMSFRGGRFFGQGLQRGVFIVCGLALFYFSGFFVMSAVSELVH